MTASRRDSGRVPLAAPASIPALGPSLAGLEIAAPVTAGPFLVDGARAFVVGALRGGVLAVSIDGTPTLADLHVGLGSAAGVVLYPGVVRREFAGPGGACVETIVVAPTLPFVVLQWGFAGGALPAEIHFDLPQTGRDTALERTQSGLSWVSGDGRMSAVGATPAPKSIDVSEGDRVRVVIRPPDEGPFSLVVAAGSAATVNAAFAASAHLPAHGRRAAEGPCEGGLRLATGLRDVDDGVAWARARLRAIIDRMAVGGDLCHSRDAEVGRGQSYLLAGLAAVGSGDRDGAQRALSADRSEGTAAGALIAARYAMAFGDASPALKYARAWLATGAPAGGSSALGSTLEAMVPQALADALRHSAPAATIEELRKLRRPTGRKLPVIGNPGGAPPGMGIPEGDVGDNAGNIFRTDPDAAWIEWRNALSHGLAGGPAGPGSWDSVDVAVEGVPGTATAGILLTLTRGLLGLDPDAPVGRIRIAPRLPSHLTRFSARGITVGDASLSLEYERSGAIYRFTLLPEIAAVPPLVVFEPAVHGRIREVRIDGEIADLESHSAGPMTVAPVQIPLDAPRTIELVTI